MIKKKYFCESKNSVCFVNEIENQNSTLFSGNERKFERNNNISQICYFYLGKVTFLFCDIMLIYFIVIFNFLVKFSFSLSS